MHATKLSVALLLSTALAACVGESYEEELVEVPDSGSVRVLQPLRALANAQRGTFTSTHFENSLAVKIPYAIARAQGPEKGAIVISNGRSETFEQYAEVVEDLTRRGYTLYLLDHRGQGHATRLIGYFNVGDEFYQKGYVDNFWEYVDDLHTFVTRVVKPDRVGKSRKLFGLGHSMGGTVMTMYAMKFPDVFDKLVLTSPMFRLPPEFKDDAWLEAADTISPNSYAPGKGPWKPLAFDGNPLTHDPDRLAAKQAIFANDVSARVGGPTIHWVFRAFRAADECRDHSDRVTAPILLFSSSRDRIIDPAGHYTACDRLNGVRPGNCIIVNSDTSRHEPLFERDGIRTAVLDRLQRFLEQ